MARLQEKAWRLVFPDDFPQLEVNREGGGNDDVFALAEESARQVSTLTERLGRVVMEPGKDDRELRMFVKNLLGSLDGLDRIVDFAQKSVEKNPELDNWLVSLRALQAKQQKAVESIGLVPMDCIGSKLDLNLHEVVKTVRNPSVPPETVVEVAQKGYYFRGKILRDAKVVVAQ